MNTIKATFKCTGGLTRSTAGNEPPDPLEEALHWIWSWGIQVKRLKASTAEQGRGETPLETRQSFSRASFDEHMLAVTGWNLARALNSAQPRLSNVDIAQHTRDALRLLRNLYEHWDEQRESFRSINSKKTRSGAEFLNTFPHGKPWSVTYAENDWLLGGVLGIGELTRQLMPIEKEILAIQAQQNER